MHKYDVTIKAHPKDYMKLKYVIDSLKYLVPQPESIYLITPDKHIPVEYKDDPRLVVFSDEEVLPSIERKRMRYRPNWFYSMLMGLFQDITPNEYYFDVQADNIFTKELHLFDEAGKPIFFIAPVNKHYHPPYFLFNEKVVNIIGRPGAEMGIEKDDSFITGFMTYKKSVSKEMLDIYGGLDGFYEKCVEVIEDNCMLGDYEIYPCWCIVHHPEMYTIQKELPMYITGIEHPDEYDDDRINTIFEFVKERTDIFAISAHTWYDTPPL